MINKYLNLYKLKYLKYKNKYLNFKKMIGCGVGLSSVKDEGLRKKELSEKEIKEKKLREKEVNELREKKLREKEINELREKEVNELREKEVNELREKEKIQVNITSLQTGESFIVRLSKDEKIISAISRELKINFEKIPIYFGLIKINNDVTIKQLNVEYDAIFTVEKDIHPPVDKYNFYKYLIETESYKLKKFISIIKEKIENNDTTYGDKNNKSDIIFFDYIYNCSNEDLLSLIYEMQIIYKNKTDRLNNWDDEESDDDKFSWITDLSSLHEDPEFALWRNYDSPRYR